MGYAIMMKIDVQEPSVWTDANAGHNVKTLNVALSNVSIGAVSLLIPGP
jgi:hypothetical protein